MTSAARADEPAEDDPSVLLQAATDALAGERPAEAIAKLEALGDRGIVDPVVSFDRGLAYAERVRAGAERPGDLGHAAHGFEEALRLTRDATLQKDAARGLATVRAEIARRRARAGDTVDIEHGASLGRSIVELAHENVWAFAALTLSVVFAIAIVLRSRISAPRVRVAASTTAGISGAFFGIALLLAWAARDARLHVVEGVVVAPDLRLFDARRLALEGAAPVAEGTRVRILDESGGFTHVNVAGVEGWLPQSAVLPLAKR
jgi:hypothetical protein